jgi:hypothetical protein
VVVRQGHWLSRQPSQREKDSGGDDGAVKLYQIPLNLQEITFVKFTFKKIS